MPIPEERLPEVDESFVEEPSNDSSFEKQSDEDELDFESSAADESDDDDLDDQETSEADTAGFGYGEPAD